MHMYIGLPTGLTHRIEKIFRLLTLCVEPGIIESVETQLIGLLYIHNMLMVCLKKKMVVQLFVNWNFLQKFREFGCGVFGSQRQKKRESYVILYKVGLFGKRKLSPIKKGLIWCYIILFESFEWVQWWWKKAWFLVSVM